MATEITLDQLRAKALQAGLELDDEELQKLLPGVNRSRRQAAELRELLSDYSEPASIFTPLKVDGV
jgi:tRNA pseudouridine-54 N-methylase